MGIKMPYNSSAEYAKLGTDGDGLLSVHELRTVITRLYELPTSLHDWTEFEGMLLNCSHLQDKLLELGVGVGPDVSALVSPIYPRVAMHVTHACKIVVAHACKIEPGSAQRHGGSRESKMIDEATVYLATEPRLLLFSLFSFGWLCRCRPRRSG